jgi:hypothetical protein
MIVMVEGTYPGIQVDQAAKTSLDFLKDNPQPEYVKIIDMYAWSGGDGFRYILLDEVAAGKEEEGLRYISKGAVDALKSIEGYKCEVRVVYGMADAFEFLGMKAPAA